MIEQVKRGFSVLLVAGVALWAIPVFGNQFIQQAEQLAQIRNEISDLLFQIQMEKNSHNGRVQSLEGQISDLELQIRREDAQLTFLFEQEKELKNKISSGKQSGQLTTVVHNLAQDIKADIQMSLPYHIDERINSVDDVLSKFNKNEIDEQKAATRLWSILEDEERLNRENIIDKAEINLNGKTYYVEIVRLGMMIMYFQSNDGRVGFIEHTNNEWVWKELKDPKSVSDVQKLFLEMKKGIRTGFYQLPMGEQK